VFIGFDISTSIIGVTCINKDGTIILCDHCDLRKKNGLFEKAEALKEFLENRRYLQAIVQEIWIEQPFTFFKSGRSTAKTMATLQRFNGMASLVIYGVFGMEPQYVGANEARKLNGIRIPRGTKAKEEVLKFILDKVPEFDVQYTKYGNPKAGYGDRADSLVIALAARNLWKQKNLES
tara:strand:+ start:1086 stop:1619 length:534 start_codon:yes stop_codon:yes gene_type:complete